ncbi:hypothetical protein DPMN_135995 [Dreissena polymorpha]|uniref:Uncharacterized protein n=1 Tax=Dreissena polymorpha TaxID=45954 RepID=A0A9D4G4Y6_DREPO|nr:hypothetical protein DPMN_135995 [Dreissena polymorpha]
MFLGGALFHSPWDFQLRDCRIGCTLPKGVAYPSRTTLKDVFVNGLPLRSTLYV